MLDNIGKKLIGNEDERAVSPVIGVILMVAITVILAAVIAAFVLDLGDSVDSEAQAGVDISTDDEANHITLSLTTMGNSERVEFAVDDDSDITTNEDDIDDTELSEVGSSATFEFNDESGTLRVIAITEDGTETVIQTHDYDFS